MSTQKIPYINLQVNRDDEYLGKPKPRGLSKSTVVDYKRLVLQGEHDSRYDGE